jgi:hypothetical protein
MAFQTWIHAGTIDWGRDGGYYADVARHVAAGEGLVSSISMYHEGLPSFPHPTPIYPLWPLLLGTVAHVVPLELAATWLPTLLYLATLVAAASIGNRVLPESPWRHVPWARGGVLAMLVLGLARDFVEVSARPYSDTLGMLLLCGAILRARPGGGAVAGAEAGAWCAALVLVRGPFVVIAVALLVYAWFRGARIGAAATATVGGAAGLAQVAWLGTIPGASFSSLIRFDQWVVTPGLSRLDLFPRGGLPETLADRLGGVVYAYAPVHEFSFASNFGVLAYALALLVFPSVLGAAWGSLRARGVAGAALVVGGAWWLAMHAIHKQAFAEWNFGSRQALPVAWLFVVVALLALRAGGGARAAATFLVAGAVAQGTANAYVEGLQMRGGAAAVARHRAEAGWICARVAEAPGTRVAHFFPQLVARYCPTAGYVAVHPFTTLEDTRVMAERFGVSLLLVPTRGIPGEFYPCVHDDGFAEAWEEIAGAPRGTRAYRPRAVP